MAKKVFKKNQKPVSGTKEWASKNVNCINGCSHDCRYCYAKSMAVRFKRKTQEMWHIEEVKVDKVPEKFRKFKGRVMFPSTHDITPVNADVAIELLEKLLVAGNDVLIVSKPHLAVIMKMCNRLLLYRDKILFRFTIGSSNDEVLRFWEPFAPTFEERLGALKLAYFTGFQTSISIEPALDGETYELVQRLSPYVSDSIWIGLANRLTGILKLNGHVDPYTLKRAEDLKKMQTEEWVRELAEKLADDPLIRWKDSCKKILGIDRPLVSGMDV